ADMPRGRHRLNWNYVSFATLLEDQQNTRRVANLLDYDVKLLAQRGNGDDALRSCRALMNTGRSLGDEPIMISALVRSAILAIGGMAIERTLAQQTTPSDKELALLQAVLALEAKHPTMRIAVRGERAMTYDFISKAADGRIPPEEAHVMIEGRSDRGEWWQWLGRVGVGRPDPATSLPV